MNRTWPEGIGAVDAGGPLDAPPLLILQHVGAAYQSGQFGVLLHRGEPFAVTVERAYETDGVLATKIPPGRYRCVATFYHKGGYATFEILVPGHSRLLFHRGNTARDVDGCVAIGESYGQLKGITAILDSAHGFADFWDHVGGLSEFVLEVV
jgi:hypothetical protein